MPRSLVAFVGLVVGLSGLVVAGPADAAERTPATAVVATALPFQVGEGGYDGESAEAPVTDASNRAVADACAGGRPVYRPHWVRFAPTTDAVVRPESAVIDDEGRDRYVRGSVVAVLGPDQSVIDCAAGDQTQVAGPVTVRAGTSVYVVVLALYEPCAECIFEEDRVTLLGRAAVPQPVNDDWQDATPIPTLPFRQTVDDSAATDQDVDRNAFLDQCSTLLTKNSRTVWWRLTPVVSGPLTIAGASVALFELTPTGPKQLAQDCEDPGAAPVVTFGKTYLIQAGASADSEFNRYDPPGNGGPIDLAVSTTGRTRAARSNLVVTKVGPVPPHPRAGEPVRFTARIRNTGLAASPGNVTHGVSFTVDGRRVTGSSTWDGSLRQGESVTLTSNPSRTAAGAWLATAGDHVVAAEVDPDDLVVDESSESDNVRAVPLTVAPSSAAARRASGLGPAAASSASRPDLVVTHVTWSPRSPAAGAPVLFSATVRNVGTRSTPPGVPVRVSFRPDGSPSGASAGNGGGLRPQQQETITAAATWKPAAGANRIVATLDALHAIREADEANNTLETFVTAS